MSRKTRLASALSAKPALRRLPGFSMIEVLIAVAVLGILFAIAYPSYQAFVIEGNRKNAQTALTGFAAAMERYRAQNNTYTGAVAGNVYPAQVPIDEADKLYNLSITAQSDTAYTLRATPIAGTIQDGDGYLELTSTGIKRWDSDDSNSISAAENTWQD